MASMYKRGKQFWISYYVNGKQVKKSLKTKNERVAKRKLKKIEYELALGDLNVASKLNLPVILEEFCKRLKSTRTFKSYKNDFSRLRVFFGPICDSLKIGSPGGKDSNCKSCSDQYSGKHIKAELLEDITPQIMNKFIAERIQQDGWSAKTANLMRQTLHKLFAYAIKYHNFRSRDRRYPNPAKAVERRRENAPNIRFLSLNDIGTQLKVLSKYEVMRAAVATCIYSGLRREELIWLTHKDVDLEKRVIRVESKNIKGEYWQPKTKSNRLVPISDALYKKLYPYKSSQNNIWFFPSPNGQRWDPDNFSRKLRKINKANGLKWSCLDFRHTFGSHLAQKGVSLYKISKLMGNSPDICRRHYAALIPEEMTEVVEFSDNQKKAIEDDDTKVMLKKILTRLDGEKQNQPKLKLVHFGKED